MNKNLGNAKDIETESINGNAGYEFVNCNLCGSNHSIIKFTGKDRLFHLPGSFNVVQCLDCGLMYTNPRPNKETIARFYPQDFWKSTRQPEKKTLKSYLTKLNNKLINIISYKMTVPLRRNGMLLDVGCGTGEYLDSMKKIGWNVYGVEVSDIAARYAREVLGLDVLTGTLEKASFPDEIFDAVAMHQVLEHVADPTATLLEINRVMKQDGILAMSVPDACSLEAGIFGENWFPWELPRHLYHFSQGTLTTLLKKTGFQVVATKHDCNPGGIQLSARNIFEKVGMNPLVGLAIAYPLFFLLGVALGNLSSSGSMAVFAKKQSGAQLKAEERQ